MFSDEQISELTRVAERHWVAHRDVLEKVVPLDQVEVFKRMESFFHRLFITAYISGAKDLRFAIMKLPYVETPKVN